MDRMAQQPLGDLVNMRAKIRALHPAAREGDQAAAVDVSTHVQCTKTQSCPYSTAQDGFSQGRRVSAPSMLLQAQGCVPLWGYRAQGTAIAPQYCSPATIACSVL